MSMTASCQIWRAREAYNHQRRHTEDRSSIPESVTTTSSSIRTPPKSRNCAKGWSSCMTTTSYGHAYIVGLADWRTHTDLGDALADEEGRNGGVGKRGF